MNSQSETIAFLSDPRSYGEGIASVERRETHGSIVFLAGERAYKLKRAVTFPYMDYGTVALRHAMCLRELAVNLRTAPMLYLGVQPLLRAASGTLCFGPLDWQGDAIDWLVVMRRFDEQMLLADMCRRGELSLSLVRATVDEILRFHAAADVEAAFGGAAALAAVVAQNRAALIANAGRVFDPEAVRLYGDRSASAVQDVAPLLDERRSAGRVRRCHGDLHLNNVCVVGGKPVLFDAIEFNDAFSCIDVFYDFAFFLMDLQRLGQIALANAALNRYLQGSSEVAGLAALPLFLSCRAGVRAHVAVSAADATEDDTRKRALYAEAVALLDQANAYLVPASPRLVAIGGLSGTGKSTLAQALAPLIGPAPGAVVLRTDVIRKSLLGVDETVRLPDSAYTPELTQRVYAQLTARAAEALAAGASVIVDGVFGREDERRLIRDIARERGCAWVGLWLEAPLQALEARVSARVGDASDATAAIVRAQSGFVSVPEDWMKLDASMVPERLVTDTARIVESVAIN